ncbi:MAG TPA: hypothetical protein VGV85_11300 [Longimicrobiaceae bacterium]|nr:hypothetical protein [Longimicrobiaceae bacterium]
MRTSDRVAEPSPACDVQVSAAGREPAVPGEGTGLTPGRIAEVRRRILEGTYGSAEVAGRVAAAVLRSGHL